VFGVVAFLWIAARSTADVRTLLLICAAVLLVERTLGDWLADRLGAAFGNLAFLAAVGAAGWLLFGTEQGRSALSTLLVGGDHGDYVGVVGGIAVPPSTSALPPSGAVVSHGSTATPPASTSPGPGSAPSADAGGVRSPGPAAAPEGQTDYALTPTRVTVSAVRSAQDQGVAFEAEVSAGRERVSNGRVEFAVNGQVVATTSVDARGTARARVTALGFGPWRVTARFVGTSRFEPSVGSTYLIQ
jgi:hypothetical protein